MTSMDYETTITFLTLIIETLIITQLVTLGVLIYFHRIHVRKMRDISKLLAMLEQELMVQGKAEAKDYVPPFPLT